MDNEALGVCLDNVQKLLEKIDNNQERQWQELTRHGNSIVGLNGDLQKLSEITKLEIANLDQDIKDLVKIISEEVKPAVKLNTQFRQNMEGFSWWRHAVPMLIFALALASFLISIWPKS